VSPAWRLEPMGDDHLRGVMEVETRSFPSPWPEEAFLADPEAADWSHRLVLLDGARPEAGPRGFIVFWTLHGELSIQNVAVHPDDRRLGGAWKLIEAAFAEGGRAGCAWAYLEVRPSNRPALELYRRWGFVPVGRRKGYYQDSGEDALVMRAEVGGRDVLKGFGTG